MLSCRLCRWLIPTLMASLALAIGGGIGEHPAAAPIVPTISEGVVVTLAGHELTLTGNGLGEAPAARSIRFDYGSGSMAVSAVAPRVQVWQDDLVRLSLPPEVLSGRITVTVDGVESDPVDLLVYSYAPVEIPPSLGTNKHELAVAVAPDGTLWFNQEFHLELKALSPEVPPAYAALKIPQVEGPGIFAWTLFGDRRTRVSTLGEDIVVDGDGKVWFTQGGGYLYDGSFLNASRVVAYDPGSGEFECYNAPADNAEVHGVLIDEPRRMVWYSEGGLMDGNAIAGFSLDSSLSDCLFDPYGDVPPDPVCSGGPTESCHWRFPLPRPGSSPAHMALDAHGNIWFTEFWGNSIGRLTPETGEIIELPLPAPIVQQGPGVIVGSGPWELAFDDNGDLWVSEFFDATILLVTPSLLESEDCERLDKEGQNPCIEEALVASDGIDGKTLTVSVGADGLVWFGVEQDSDGDGRSDGATVGFVSPGHGRAVSFLPRIDGLRFVSGIVQDRQTRDVWFAQFADQRIGRLRQLGAGDADGDGVPDSTDNCVLVPNPDQEPLRPGGPGAACADSDTDGDGCPDSKELGNSEFEGGLRDPSNPWDYFNPTGDGHNRIDDVISVVQGYYVDEGEPGYEPKHDRTLVGPNPWNLGPPNGEIRVDDLLNVIRQFLHDCGGE